MTRQEALEVFKQYEEEVFKNYLNVFWQQLNEKQERWQQCLQAGLEQLQEKIKAYEKKEIVHFQFSVLRSGLLMKKVIILLGAYNVSWYMDEQPVEVQLDLSFLFEELNDLWEKLLQESKKYLGKVNAYDIQSFIAKQVILANQLMAHRARFLFSEIEETENFKKIPVTPFWVMRWGEYRDQSEIVRLVDHYPKTFKDFEKAIEELEDKEDQLVCSYWYKLELKETTLSHKTLHFIGFEESTLENSSFQAAGMLGSRFKNCQIKNCDFSETLLKASDFRGSHIENVNFEGADLTDAIFSDFTVPHLHLSPEQLQMIHIERS